MLIALCFCHCTSEGCQTQCFSWGSEEAYSLWIWRSTWGPWWEDDNGPKIKMVKSVKKKDILLKLQQSWDLFVLQAKMTPRRFKLQLRSQELSRAAPLTRTKSSLCRRQFKLCINRKTRSASRSTMWLTMFTACPKNSNTGARSYSLHLGLVGIKKNWGAHSAIARLTRWSRREDQVATNQG